MTRIRLERLSDVPLSRMVDAWNDCFSDYDLPIPMDMAAFVAGKLVNEDMRPDWSLVAFAEGREAPVGFLLNATRTIDGERFAWNGGTAVHRDFRAHGVGSMLLTKAKEIYLENGIQTGLLEALVQNEGAVKLYRRFGYETFDTLHGMEATDTACSGQSGADVTVDAGTSAYRVEPRPASHVDGLRFALLTPPWQTMWNSAKTGEALVAYDAAGRTAGYALFRRSPAGTTLLQCAVDPALPVEAASAAMNELLRAVFAPFGDGTGSSARRAFAVSSAQPALRAALESAGFEEKYAFVHMRLRL